MKKQKIIFLLIYLITFILLFEKTAYADYLNGEPSSDTSSSAAAGLQNKGQDSDSNSNNNKNNKDSDNDDKKYSVISVTESDLKNLKNEDEIIEVANKITSVNVDSLGVKEVIEFNTIVENFYSGSFKNLPKDKQETYYAKIYDFSVPVDVTDFDDIDSKLDEVSDLTVSDKLYKRARYWLDGKGYSENGGLNIETGKKLATVRDNRRKGKVATGQIQPPSSAAAGQGGDVTTDKTDEQKEEEAVVYQKPIIVSSTSSSGTSIEDAMNDAKEFIDSGNAKSIDLVSFSNAYYNIFLAVGVATTVIVGLAMGIKFMTSSIEQKAEAKQLLVPYIVGCVVIYGSFGIWKLAVTILAGL